MFGPSTRPGSLAHPTPQPGGPARSVGLGCLAAAVVLRPLVPDAGAGLVLEAVILLCSAAALAAHWIAAAGGFKPTWRRPTLGVVAAVVGVWALGLWGAAPDAWVGAVVAGGRLACICAFAVSLQQGDEASGGALVRGVAAAAVVAAAVSVLEHARTPVNTALGLSGPAMLAVPVDDASLLDWPPLRAPAHLPGVDERESSARLVRPAGSGPRLAAIGLLVLPLCCALFLLALYDERGRTGSALRSTVTAGAVALVTAVVLLAGGSLGAIALVVALGTLALVGRRHLPMADGRPRFLWALLPLAFGIAAAVVVPRLPHAGLAPVFGDGQLGELWTERGAAWSRVPGLVQQRPLVGIGPAGYAAADAGLTAKDQPPVAGAGCTPATLAVEAGIPFALLWFGLLIAAVCVVRVRVAAPAVDPALPPPRPPIRTTMAAMAMVVGGAIALLLPLLTGRAFPLATAVAVLPLWIGVAGAFACPERPHVRPFPPLLRAAGVGGVVAVLAYALCTDTLVHPSVALGVFAVVGALAATPWVPPADERPERPARPVARAAAWAAPSAVGLAALLLLPLAGLADGAIAEARDRSVAGRLRGAELLRLPGATRSATLQALRGRALTSLYYELMDAPPSADRARGLKPILDEGLRALGQAQIAWPAQPAPVVVSANVALSVLADLEAVMRDDAGATQDPELRAWRSKLISNAVRDARLAAHMLPNDAGAHFALARALLANGDVKQAADAMQVTEGLAATAAPGRAPSDDELARTWRRIHAASGG